MDGRQEAVPKSVLTNDASTMTQTAKAAVRRRRPPPRARTASSVDSMYARHAAAVDNAHVLDTSPRADTRRRRISTTSDAGASDRPHHRRAVVNQLTYRTALEYQQQTGKLRERRSRSRPHTTQLSHFTAMQFLGTYSRPVRQTITTTCRPLS